MSSAVSPEEAIVEFREVHKSFGSQSVLRGLNLRIPRGKVTFIIGRSGEGKSVTIKHFVGVLKPDAGEIFFDGKKLHPEGEGWGEVRKKMGLLFQDGALFDSLTVEENVAFALQEHRRGLNVDEMEKEVSALLELVGLPGTAHKFPSQLSIGEKKRVGLARALSLRPQILLYDEPTTSMDPLISNRIDELIKSMQEKIAGLSSVVISHDVRSVMTVADNIVMLHEGKVYLEGTPEEFRNCRDPLIRQFLMGSRHGPLSRPLG